MKHTEEINWGMGFDQVAEKYDKLSSHYAQKLDASIMGQLQLPHFDGPAYEPEKDQERLANQHERIKALMLDGRWRTLRQIAQATNSPESSVSAQLRHLRKPRFGAYNIERRRVAGGLYEYRIAL